MEGQVGKPAKKPLMIPFKRVLPAGEVDVSSTITAGFVDPQTHLRQGLSDLTLNTRWCSTGGTSHSSV